MVRKRFHNLKRPKIRQDWSKWTLFNLSKMRDPFTSFNTFFQQKWQAKSLTRGFHGNQVREQKWQLMFDRRLPAVVPMDYKKLAGSDGALQSAGRGTGVDGLTLNEAKKSPKETPYMHMTYWPIERRLDTAVWRALFASSALQARQFVVHGWVKVNGKKMLHPGYLLNPGDMFSVDPERVMYATGARKFKKDSPDSYGGQGQNAAENEETDAVEEVVSEDGAAQEAVTESTEAEEVTDATPKQHREALKVLLTEAKDILADPKEKSKMSGKQKQAMRAFARKVRTTMSRIRGGETVKTDEGEALVSDTVADLQATLETLTGVESTSSANVASGGDAPTSTSADAASEESISPSRDAAILRRALDQASEVTETQDASKPYATPWRPREYMSAFAFIPRYLEVSQRICSAVYLRHPVARPGLAEVPSPYGETTYQLAHNWYLRRR